MDVARVINRTVEGGLAAGAHAYGRLFPGPVRLAAPLATRAPATANPVVLIGGWTNDASFLDVWNRSLTADGFRAFAWNDPQHGFGDVRDAARRLDAYVEQVRVQTGAAKVDIVGYSAGNTIARTWMQLVGGAPRLHTLIDLDGSWNGDDDSRVLHRFGSVPLLGATLLRAMPASEWDLQRTSPLFTELNRHPELPAGVRVTSIYAARDELDDVVPGGHNVALADSPGHIAMARTSATAYDAARTALLEP